VRIPSRFEHDMFSEIAAFPGDDGTINVPAINGDRNFDSEDLLAFEAGHRMNPLERLTVDTAVFYNIYDHLRTFDLTGPFPDATPAPHLVLPLHTTNNMEGESYGIEIANHLQLTNYWRITGSYSLFILYLHSLEFNQDLLNAEGDEGASPEHQFQIRSNLNLPKNFTFDAAWYYVDDLEDYQIPSYHRVDARLAWNPRQDTEISLVIQNIFEARHLEFGPEFLTTPTEVERVIYAKYTFIY
jgi:iron complex outermembrane receptor protein